MGQTEVTRQADEILPAIQGSVYAIAVTAAPVIVDLQSLANTAALPSSTVKGSENLNPLGQYLTLVADGAPVYYACAQTFAALSGVTVATVTTVNGTTGVVTASPNAMQLLPSGIPQPFRFPPGPSTNTTAAALGTVPVGGTVPHGALSNARFIALACATGATSTLRINVSSR